MYTKTYSSLNVQDLVHAIRSPQKREQNSSLNLTYIADSEISNQGRMYVCHVLNATLVIQDTLNPEVFPQITITGDSTSDVRDAKRTLEIFVECSAKRKLILEETK